MDVTYTEKRAKNIYEDNIKYEINQETEISRELLQKAINLDGDLIEAKILLSRTYFVEYYYAQKKGYQNIANLRNKGLNMFYNIRIFE